jgi:hypothetical protein
MSSQNEKVHIPDSFEEFDVDSETLNERSRSIDAYTEVIPGIRSKEGQDNHQVWHTEVDGDTEGVSHIINEKLLNKESCQDKAADSELLQMLSFQSQPAEANESIINSQESIITDDGGERDKVLDDRCFRDKICSDEEKDKDQVERRRSERLKKEIHLTTKEKNETMAKKKKSGR